MLGLDFLATTLVKEGHMQAIQVTEYGSKDVLELINTDLGTIEEGQVRLNINAIGVNFADILQRRGDYMDGPTPPFIPGMEAAGTIEAVGEGVERSVGDRVVAMVNTGMYAEKAIVSKYALLSIPDWMDFTEAAGFPVQFLTAYNILHDWANLQEDEQVLIHAAAGGVGSAATQIADAIGAEIFATASTAEKLDLARNNGADHLINYKERDFTEEIDEITDGRGVDLVLDGVGGDVFHDSLDALAHFGRIVPFGDASGVVPKVDTGRIRFENKTVIGFHLGQAMKHDYRRVLNAVPELESMLESESLYVHVGKTFDLVDAAKAHEFVENRRSTGKVVLLP